MTRIAIIALCAVLTIGGSVWVGMNWDDAEDEKRKSDTLERAQSADTSKGDADDNRDWTNDFLEWLPSITND